MRLKDRLKLQANQGLKWLMRNTIIRELTVTPPAARPGRNGIAIVLYLKNGASYIEEWLSFHRAAGIDHVFVYDNGSTDGTAEVVRKATDPSFCTLVPWAIAGRDFKTHMKMNFQMLAYSHAINSFGPDYRWVAFIDGDEFMVPTGNETLGDIFASLDEFSNVSIPWLMFGHNGHQTPPKGGVLKNYTRRAPKGHVLNWKCVVDPTKVTRIANHYFETTDMGEMTANVLGKTAPNSARDTVDFITFDRLQFNHYYTKSVQETEEKIERGCAAGNDRNRLETRVRYLTSAIEEKTEDDTLAVEVATRLGVLT